MQQKFSIFNKHLQVSPFAQALFTASLTIFILILTGLTPYSSTIGFTVVTAISIAGINADTRARYKIKTAAYAIPIYLIIVILGFLAGQHWILIIPCTLISCWIFASSKHYFPDNWGEINLPAGLIFYLAFSHSNLLEALIATLISGIICLLAQVIFAICHPAKKNKTLMKQRKYRKIKVNFLGLSPHLNLYFIQLSVLLSLGNLVFHSSSYPHTYWLPFTILVVLQVSYRLTLKRIRDRFIGTLSGCLLGCYILILHPNYWIFVAILGITLFFFMLYAKKNYAIAVFFITIFVLLLMGYNFKDAYSIMGYSFPSDYVIALERLCFTLLGGFLAFISSLIFLKDKQH